MMAATLSSAVSSIAAAYVMNHLLSKFSSGLKPSSVKLARESSTIEITLLTQKESSLKLDDYKSAVTKTLAALVAAPKSATCKPSRFRPGPISLRERLDKV